MIALILPDILEIDCVLLINCILVLSYIVHLYYKLRNFHLKKMDEILYDILSSVMSLILFDSS